MKAKLLINPFERLAGWPGLILGLALMAFTAVAGWATDAYFDGVIDIHIRRHSLPDAFIAQAADWAVMLLCLWAAALIFSKAKFRFVDLAATVAISRAPMILAAGALAIPFFRTIVGIYVFGMVAFALLVWMAFLLYNGYSVSCNIKGGKAIVSMLGALVVAEGLSILLYMFVLTGLFPVRTAAEPVFYIPQEQTIQQTAAVVMDSFDKGDYKTIAKYFTPAVKQGLPEAKLRMLWSQFILSNGAFKSAETDVEPRLHDGYRILFVPCHFKRGDITLRLVFDKDGYLAGFFIEGV